MTPLEPASPFVGSPFFGGPWPVLGAVALASLLGSGHCLGMCGAFAAMASGTTPAPTRVALTVRSRQSPLHRLGTSGAYALGRLTTYMALGAMAGLLGAALDLGGAALGVQRAALVLAGALMILFAAVTSLRALGVRLPHTLVPSSLLTCIHAGHRAAAALRPLPRALIVGLLTTLLPCGWLYAFVVLAAGTGSAVAGALVMCAFWLGTVPALAAVGLGAQAFATPLRRHPALAALVPVLLAGLGLWTIVGRWNVPPLALHRAGPVTVQAVHVAADEVPPCCRASHDDNDDSGDSGDGSDEVTP